MPGEHAQLRVGQQVERLLGDRERVHRGPRRPTAAASATSISAVGVEQVAAARPSASAARRAPTSARGWRCRRRPRTRGARGRARRGCRGRSASRRRSGRNASGTPCESDAVEPGHGGRAHREAAARSSRSRSGRRCMRVRHQHQPAGRELAGGDRAQQDLRADVVAADQRPRPAHVAQKPAITSASQSGVYGCRGRSSESPCSGRSGSTSRNRSAELLHHRLPLAVREQPRVQQRQRAARAGLAVRDARAVGVVVEAELHGPGRRPWRWSRGGFIS